MSFTKMCRPIVLNIAINIRCDREILYRVVFDIKDNYSVDWFKTAVNCLTVQKT